MQTTAEVSFTGRWVIRLGNSIEKASGGFCSVLFVLMILSALLGVFFRYVMKSPFQWTEEVARYSLIWMSFTAINMAVWRGEHISIKILVNFLPGSAVKWFVVFVNILCGFFLLVLLLKGYKMTNNTMMTAQSMPVSMFWFYLAVPVSACLSLIQIFLSTLRIFLSPDWQPLK